MKKMINEIDDVIIETLQGIAKAHPELDVNMEPMYIVNKQDKPKVALVSGGGSGHEPMHGGFVGLGMLDGACPGQMFTSPTPDQMYECGQKVDSGEGVLFLVKNYTGDVLNFETAVELLHDDGIKVQAALIDDDVAVKDSLYTAGRRGVAVTVLAEKILGAAAEKGYSLEKCNELAIRIANRGRSFGVALDACTVPAAGKPSFVLADDEIEFGVGIHGEPGIKRTKFTSGDAITADMMAEILDNTPYQRIVRSWDIDSASWIEENRTTEALNKGDKVIVLVNSLGSTPQSELYCVYRKVAEMLEQQGITIARNLVGTYCSSIDMQGLSISVLKVDDEMLSLWDAPVNTPALRWGI
ncbi:dihydroxyacetone kinase subunit DhaK [Vibrio sp. TH_r3]|uniref:dihydroxyacetone kinase subunit DhaK n=1 Tax=unclassified Vibrio TaxID=2614977 RepID=UPI002954D783|nr:dihydroxyacetone kinase subunit DhaK [Vibrio sp. TH_r3]MDV7104977.1 dihydroxyacetone kinase subunit DhaK [Vibrio sp. TH_r3]